MTATVRSLAAFAAVAALLAAAGQPTAAQKEGPKKKAAAAGTVVIKQGKDDKYRFSIYDGNDKFLGMSPANGFETKAEAVKALEHLKEVLKDAKVVDGKKAAAKDEDDEKEMKEEKAPAKKKTKKE